MSGIEEDQDYHSQMDKEEEQEKSAEVHNKEN